ncbi:MAG: GntR family transcriptional regulator [Hungatella sp.]|nr:GntR family transcriptional regulator [Hungatella sp.]
MTKYEVISSDIRKKIQNGTFPLNSQLPTEPELGEQYNVSRITVKKAIDQLVSEGLVIKKRGSGTFVKGLAELPGTGELPPQASGLFQTLDKSRIKSDVVLFEIIPAQDEVAGKLNIQPDDFVYHIIRYRYDQSSWRTLDFCYMPILLIPGLKKEHLYQSIYEYIESSLGLRIQSAHRVITARRPDKYDKKYLGLRDTDPVLCIEQVGYLDSGIPFEYSTQHHIGDDYEFKTVSLR